MLQFTCTMHAKDKTKAYKGFPNVVYRLVIKEHNKQVFLKLKDVAFVLSYQVKIDELGEKINANLQAP